MRVLNSIAASVLICSLLPIILMGYLGVLLAGKRPIYRREQLRPAEQGPEFLAFNPGNTKLEHLYRNYGMFWLPSLFCVAAGSLTLRDVLVAADTTIRD